MGYGQFVNVLKERSLERHGKFFIPYLQQGMRIVDCGCGPGTITIGLAKKVAPGEVVGVDIEESQIELAARLAKDKNISNIRFESASLYNLPFPDSSFDAAFIHNVLLHVGDPAKALREVHRVLKKGGMVGMSHPDGGVGAKFYPPDEHIALDAQLFSNLLQKNGGIPRFAPRQGVLLYEAGYNRVEISADYFTEGTQEAVRAYAAMRANRIAEGSELADRLINAGLTNKVELLEIRNAWKSWGDKLGAFFAASLITAVGWKD